MERLRRRFPHTLVLQFDPQGAPVPVRSYAQRAHQQDPLDVCCTFLDHVRGHAASDEERDVVARAVEAVRVERAGHDDEGQLTTARRQEGAA
jgi:exonuclease SbcD